MALLSNINNLFSVDSTGAIEFSTQVGTTGYVLESRGAGNAPVWTDRDTGKITGSGAANRVTYWTGTYSIGSDAGFTYNGAGRVNTDESFGVSKDGADTVADGPFFRLTNAAATRQYINQLDASNNIDYWYYNGTAWTQTISLLTDGGATFAGNVSCSNLTASVRLFSGDGGNKTNPMIANGSDEDTGIFFPAANTMAFTAGDTEAFRIAGANATFAGNVGIGVAAHGTASLNITNANQHIRLNNGSELGIINLDADGKLDLWAHGTDETINFRTGTGSGTVTMSVVGEKVGIGTELPDDLLTLSSSTCSYTTAPILRFDSTCTDSDNIRNWAIGPADSSYGNFHIFKSAARGGDPVNTAGIVATINYLGNVGIGTPSPDSILHVNGYRLRLGDGNSDSKLWGTPATGGNFLIGQSSSTGKIKFVSNADSDLMTILNDGNVGIGVTGPGVQLEVGKSATIGAESVTTSTTNHENVLKVKGKNNYSDGTTWYGDYGQILLSADSNMTGSAHQFLITNALDNNKFAIVRSVDANTAPVVNSTATGVNSGTADFVIDGAGKVGIGTDSPSSILDVVDTSGTTTLTLGRSGEIPEIKAGGTNTDLRLSAVGPGGFLDLQTNGSSRMLIASSGQIQFNRTGQPPITNSLYGNIVLSTDAAANYQRIRFDVAGYAYWGLTKLATSNNFAITGRINNTWEDHVLEIEQSTGNIGVGMSLGVFPGKFNVSGNSGLTTTGVGDGIFVGPYQGNSAVGSNWAYSNSGYTYTDFCSRYNSSDSYMRFVMKASATPVYAMTIRGDGRVGVIGTFTAAGDVVAYSDKKLKKNIKTLDGSKVYKMRGVGFDRIDTGKKSSGVIAQEMQEVAPELVSENEETLGVAYGNLSGYLIEAIKELKAEIEELKSNKCNCNK